MEQLRGLEAENVRIITPDDGMHYFFGYYDMRPAQGSKHLCHRVAFMDRMPQANDVAELGYLENGVFTPFATTTAWNFQQGAMLQYHPYLADTVYYNACIDGKFCTVTHNYTNGEKRYTDRATACISPNGKWGLAVNFGRIFAFRPGYGYAGFRDAYENINAPVEDGVFLVDMEAGTSHQVVDYQSLSPIAGFSPEDKILINHITFNTASDRFLMLVRSKKANGGWTSSVVISDLTGNCHCILSCTHFSHYYWLGAEDLIAYCTEDGKRSMYRISSTTGSYLEYDMPYFRQPGNRDIHCILSPDGNYIIGDGYPLEGYRHIMAYSLKTGESKCLLEAKTVIPPIADMRCDLHVRFLPGGQFISFDTTHNDRRQVAVFPIDSLNF